MSTAPAVTACSVSSCAFNKDGCSAVAVTIGSGTEASCGTFIALDARGGLPTAAATVGACQRANCKFNSDLLCTADGITVGVNGSSTADCLTFEAR